MANYGYIYFPPKGGDDQAPYRRMYEYLLDREGEVAGEREASGKGYDRLDKILKMLVGRILPLPVDWGVERLYEDPEDGFTWHIFLKGSQPRDEEEARRYGVAPGEDMGFTVGINPAKSREAVVEVFEKVPTLVFRHSNGGNGFLRWCQGCIEEEMAEVLNLPVYYDATGASVAPGSKEYRGKDKTRIYLDYLSRNFKKPLSMGDKKYLAKTFKESCPPGFWVVLALDPPLCLR